MKRILAAIEVLSLAALATTATATASSQNPADTITICHATGSDSNPFVPVTIRLNGLNGHVGHQHEEDIIPPNDGAVLPGGQNWTADGQAMHHNGCAAVTGTETDTPTATPTVTPTEDTARITICHATGSATNPYVQITISLNGLNGHGGHQHEEDIIPPNSGTVLSAGQNWTAEGRATFGNACVPLVVTETVPPTVPPTTPAAPPTGAVVVPKPKPSGAVVGKPAARVPAVGAAKAHQSGLRRADGGQ